MIYIIVVMNTNQSLEELERQIDIIKQNLLALGPMHPGSVSRQYQKCGNPACKCMRTDKPEKHGPYYKLAYVHRGKRVCRFVRAACVEDLKPQLAAYKKFRMYMDKWVELSIKRGMATFFAPTSSNRASKPK
jgi:hypothetical protein